MEGGKKAKTFIIHCVCFVLLLFSFHGFSEQSRAQILKNISLAPSDSDRVNALFKYGETFEQVNTDSALYWYNAANALALKSNYITGQLRYHDYTGILYLYLNQFDSTLAHAGTSLELARKNKNKRFEATALNSFGTVYQYKADMNKAADYYVHAYAVAEMIHDTLLMNGIAGNLSGVFIEIKRYDKARQFAQIGYNLSLAMGDELGVGYSLVNLGTSEIFDKHFDTALKYSLEAIDISKTFADESLLLSAIANVAASVFEQQKTDSAMEVYRQMRDLSVKLESDYHYIYAQEGLGNCYYRQNNFLKAIDEFKKGITVCIKLGNKSKEFELRKMLSLCYEMSGNERDALAQARLNEILRDSINAVEQNKNISELEEKYQAEKKQKELAEKNLLLKQEQERSQKRLLGFVFSIAAIAGLLVFIYQRRKLEKQKQIALQKETELRIYKSTVEERTRLAADLHDDIGSTLSSISIYASSAVSNIEKNKPEKALQAIKQAGYDARETIAGMSDIVWAINPQNDNTEKLFQRMHSFAVNLITAKDTTVNFEVDTALQKREWTMQERKTIFLIFKEAINNSAKYANARNINIALAKKHDKTEMIIKDDGIGFDEKTLERINGLHNMKMRAGEIGGKLTIESIPGKGTSVSVII